MGVITWAVKGVDFSARFVRVARVSVDNGRCLPTTGSCPVHVVALGGAVQIVALVALETGAATAPAAAVTGTRTVLVRGADCIDAIDASLVVCDESTRTTSQVLSLVATFWTFSAAADIPRC